jgi:hypothetical protein
MQSTQINQFTVSDPNQVPDVFANGPINLQIGPEVSTITFTSVRPDIDKLMHGQTDPKAKAIVVNRVVVPNSIVAQLHTMLGQGLSTLAIKNPIAAAGPQGGAVTPSGKSH